MNDEGINEILDWGMRVKDVGSYVQDLWYRAGDMSSKRKIGFRLLHESE